jgi:hypothetical protein
MVLAGAAVPAAHARSVSGSPALKRRTVSVEIRGARADSPILAATLFEVLTSLGLSMVEPRAAGSGSELLASVEIERSADAARVVVISPSGSTVLDRVVSDPNPEIEREKIVAATRGAVEARLFAEQDHDPVRESPATSFSPVKAPPPATLPSALVRLAEPGPPVAAAERASESGPSLASDLALDGSLFSGVGPVAADAGMVTRVGGAATLVYRRGLEPALTLSGLYALPFDLGGQSGSGARASVMCARALGTIQAFRRPWFVIDVGVGGGLDAMTVKPRTAALPVPTVPTQPSFEPVITAVAAARFPVASNLVLTLSAALDVNPWHAGAGGAGGAPALVQGSSDLLSMWMMRPMLLAGFSFTAAGRSRFAAPAGRSMSVELAQRALDRGPPAQR